MTALDVDRLAALGFFEHVAATALTAAVEQTRQRGHPFAAEVHRLYHADAEDLAERGVRDFLGAVAPFLHRQGVAVEVHYRPVKVPSRGDQPARIVAAAWGADGWLDPEGPVALVKSLRVSLQRGGPLVDVTEDEEDDADAYALLLGEQVHVILDAADGDSDSWRLAARRTIALLDDLLLRHRSPERAYGLMGGNDLHVAFLTPAMAAVIDAAAVAGERLHDGTGG